MSVLRQWFGPSKEEIWRQVSSAVGGKYVDGGFWNKDRVEASHGEWTVVLDTHAVSTGKTTVVYTRMRAPYVNPDGFRFNVYRTGVFTDIGKWFGMQDVNVGVPAFDDAFVVQGSDETKLRRLFANEKIRQLLETQPAVRFSVKDDDGNFWRSRFPQNVDELHFQVVGVIKDADRLKLLFDLFAETLDELCRIGSAYKDAPDVTV